MAYKGKHEKAPAPKGGRQKNLATWYDRGKQPDPQLEAGKSGYQGKHEKPKGNNR